MSGCHKAASADPVGSPDDGWAGLAAKVAALPVDGDPSTLQSNLPSGVTLATSTSTITLTLAQPADAGHVAGAFHWSHPYAISGDVHQAAWQLQIFVREVADPNNHRIATARPVVGAWSASVTLDGRPKGDLPGIVAGASPAYDLDRYQARIVRIQFGPKK